ncbi:glycosyltransferase [Photobacterium sagamiensis]|uniref:glycosyltransferase family 2 protein n=1 Tax=Photobacterium sagamiensis TaxID=2910241 RepID=UPI003D0DF55D
MKSEPLVSVLIPVYNCEKYIRLALESVLFQSYRNLEVLVCDDGSIDKSIEEIEKVAATDNRVLFLRNKNNIGKVDTINNLISIATGTYISFLDSDDLWDMNKIQVQVEFLEKNDEYVFISTSCSRIDELGRKIGEDIISANNEVITECLLSGNGMTVCCSSTLVRSNYAKKVGGFNKYFHDCNGEDLDFIARLMAYGKGMSLPDLLYSYRFRSNSLTRRVFSTVRQRHSHQVIAFLYKQRIENEGKDSLNSDLNGLEDYMKQLEVPYTVDSTLMSRQMAVDYAISGEFRKSLFHLKSGFSFSRLESFVKALIIILLLVVFPRNFLLKVKNLCGLTKITGRV